MVLVPVDPSSVADAMGVARAYRCSLWLGSDALTESQISQLRREGLSVTVMNRPLTGADAADIAELVATIAEHHPGESIWVENRVSP